MEQLKITDLSIGDWVKVDDEYRIVRGIDATTGLISLYSLSMPYGLGVVRPIPITPEILEQNGWTAKLARYENQLLRIIEEFGNRPFIEYRYDYERLVVERSNDYKMTIKMKYIHELQHAFRLAGVNKEIKL